jgi:hypothetical protein
MLEDIIFYSTNFAFGKGLGKLIVDKYEMYMMGELKFLIRLLINKMR